MSFEERGKSDSDGAQEQLVQGELSEVEDWLVEQVQTSLSRGRVPPIFLDPTSQDLLVDPVIAEDGHCYSRQNILNWIEVSSGSALLSPLTGRRMGDSLLPDQGLAKLLGRLVEAGAFKPYCKTAEGFSDTETKMELEAPDPGNSKKDRPCTEPHRRPRHILSLCRLAAVYEQIDNYLVVTMAEKHPNWRVPQLAVLGLAGAGKSSLLERLLLISVFPCRQQRHPPTTKGVLADRHTEEQKKKQKEEDGGGYTYVPLHIKLRHVHQKLAAHQAMPPVVIRVIDTDKKVQVGDARILPSFDSAHLEIGRVMRKLRREEVVSGHINKANSGPASQSQPTHAKSSLLAAIRGHGSTTPLVAARRDQDVEEKEKEKEREKGALKEKGEKEVGMSRAIVVHIYSPLVPTLNLVDLPGLLPSMEEQEDQSQEEIEEGDDETPPPTLPLVKSTSSDKQQRKSRPPLPRSNSLSSLRTGPRRRGSRDSSLSSSDTGTGSFPQNSIKRKASFSQRQTWQSVTASERRLEIVERYILSYPDSLYLLLTNPGRSEERCKQSRYLVDSSLQELVRHYELQSRTIGVLVQETMPPGLTAAYSSYGDSSNRELRTRDTLDALTTELPLPLGHCAVSLWVPLSPTTESPDRLSADQGDDSALDVALHRHLHETRQLEDVPHDAPAVKAPLTTRYASLLLSAHNELTCGGDSTSGGQNMFSCNTLIALINHAYIQDLKTTWIPLALQELFLEKEKLQDMDADLGLPLPPPSFIRCPAVFYRDMESSSPQDPTASLIMHYAFDLHTHTSPSGIVEREKYSQTFMTCLLTAIRGCLSHAEYLAKTHALGATVLNPFLEGVQRVCRGGSRSRGHASCGMRVDDCLNPDTSVKLAVMTVRNQISVACEECLTRMKSFWGQAVSDILFGDLSSFKLQRFPQLMQHLRSSLTGSFEDVFETLPTKWNGVLESFFDIESGGSGGVCVEYEFTPLASHCEITWQGELLGNLLLAHLVSRSHLVSFHQLQRRVYDGVESFFRGLEDSQQSLVEEHGGQRQEIAEHMLNVEESVQGVLGVALHSAPPFSENSIAAEVGGDRLPLTLKSVGLDIQLLKSSRFQFTPKLLRAGGFSALEVLQAGCTISELRLAGFPVLDGPWGGFTLRELRACPSPCSALLALIRQLLAQEKHTLVTLVREGFHLEELRAAGFDVFAILAEDSDPDETNDNCARRAAAAQALGTALDLDGGSALSSTVSPDDEAGGAIDLESLLDDGVVEWLLRLLDSGGGLPENSITQAKCAAAEALASLCRAVLASPVSTSRRHAAGFDNNSRHSLDSDAHMDTDSFSDRDNDGEDNSGCHDEDGDKEGEANSVEDSLAEPLTLLDQLLDQIVEGGGVQLLMHTCHSCLQLRKIAAQNALRAFSVTSSAMHALATAGAIEPLVERLLEGGGDQRGWAAQALCRFSCERDQAHASAVLSVESHLIEGLVACLTHEEVRFREAAAKALSNLARDDADMRFIASKGALQALVTLMDPRKYRRQSGGDEDKPEEMVWWVSGEDGSCLTAVALALRNLATSQKNADVLCDRTQAVEYLISQLGARVRSTSGAADSHNVTLDDVNGDRDRDVESEWEWEVAEAAACALGAAAQCKEVKVAIADSQGALLQLNRLVQESSDSCCEAATWMLGCLAREVHTHAALWDAQIMASLLTTLRRQPQCEEEWETRGGRARHRSIGCLTATAWTLRYITTPELDVEAEVPSTSEEELPFAPLLAEACSPAIPLLLSLLSPPSPEGISRVALQAASAWALYSIASYLRNCKQIINAGAIWPLLRLLGECHLAISSSDGDAATGTDTGIINEDDDSDEVDALSAEYVSCKEAVTSLLLKIGYGELRLAGVTLAHLRDAGVTVSVMAVQQRAEGSSAEQLAEAGFNYWEMAEAGCKLISSVLRPGERQEDCASALAVLLTGDKCDDRTFRAMLEADLLGALRVMLHNSRVSRAQDLSALHRVKQKAVRLIPLLIAKGISCPALLVHSGVLSPLIQMLSQPDDDHSSKCLAARALASLSAAAIPKAKVTSSGAVTGGGEATDGGVLSTVQEEDESEDEISFHEMLLSLGVLQLLGQMTRHPLLRCRRTAVVSLKTVMMSSVCHNVGEGVDDVIHKAQQACLQSFFAVDHEAIEALVLLMSDRSGRSSRNNACSSGHKTSSESSSYPAVTDKTSGVIFSKEDEDEECASSSASIHIMCVLTPHPAARARLMEAGVVTAVLSLLGQDTAALQQAASPALSDNYQDCHDRLELDFPTQHRVEQLVLLLRQLWSHHSANTLLPQEHEGLKVLTQCLCLPRGVLSETRRADVLWTLEDVVLRGDDIRGDDSCPAVLLAGGGIAEVLAIVFGWGQQHEKHENGDRSCEVLEAAMAVLLAVLRFKRGALLWRVLNQASPLSRASKGVKEDLAEQLQVLAAAWRGCHSVAVDILNILTSQEDSFRRDIDRVLDEAPSGV